MRVFIKLVIAALVIHATLRAGQVYFRHYKFRDGLQQTAQFSGTRPEAELHNRVLELAREHQIPLNPDAISVRRVDNHTLIDVRYTDEIEILPSYRYPWGFVVKVDTFTLVPHDVR